MYFYFLSQMGYYLYCLATCFFQLHSGPLSCHYLQIHLILFTGYREFYLPFFYLPRKCTSLQLSFILLYDIEQSYNAHPCIDNCKLRVNNIWKENCQKHNCWVTMYSFDRYCPIFFQIAPIYAPINSNAVSSFLFPHQQQPCINS